MNSSLSSAPASCICVSKCHQGVIYRGHGSTIARCQFEQEDAFSVTHELDLKTSSIQSIHEAEDGLIWVARKDGAVASIQYDQSEPTVNLFDSKKHSGKIIPMFDELWYFDGNQAARIGNSPKQWPPDEIVLDLRHELADGSIQAALQLDSIELLVLSCQGVFRCRRQGNAFALVDQLPSLASTTNKFSNAYQDPETKEQLYIANSTEYLKRIIKKL